MLTGKTAIEHLGVVTRVRDEKLITKFGKHLVKLRTQSKLSQEDLANDADIPINQIGRIERGEVNPTLSTLNAIARALNVRLSKLVDFE